MQIAATQMIACHSVNFSLIRQSYNTKGFFNNWIVPGKLQGDSITGLAGMHDA